MNRSQVILTIALTLFASGAACAQDDQQPAPPPAPAFGQENSVPTVAENPPISSIDQPGLEPHAAPESFLLPGLHVSESIDSNVGNTLGGSSTGLVTRALGSLTLQKLWKTYDVAVDYIGGVADYARVGVGVEQLHQFDIDNRINWRRGQLAILDSLSYLPEGTFGFSAYGGSGAYNSGLGSLGAGLLGAGAFAGQTSVFFGQNEVSLGQVPRLSNLGLITVMENLTPKSSVTFAAGYGLVHFYGDLVSLSGTQQNITFVGSTEFSAQAAYDRVLTPKDQVALLYGFQAFNFSTVNAAFHTNVLQVMYGHRISGRMDFTVGVGPQFTHVVQNPLVCTFLGFPFDVPNNQCLGDGGSFTVLPETANSIGVAGSISLRYRFPRTTVALSLQRYNTDGAGIFAGSLSTIAHVDAQRPLNRVWDLFSDVGYAKNSRLQLAGSGANANSFNYGYAGVGVHRQFGRSLRGFLSYQFNILSFDTSCPVPGTPTSTLACNNISQRQVGSIGLDWTPQPIRLD
jgi:hypothetical protein